MQSFPGDVHRGAHGGGRHAWWVMEMSALRRVLELGVPFLCWGMSEHPKEAGQSAVQSHRPLYL